MRVCKNVRMYFKFLFMGYYINEIGGEEAPPKNKVNFILTRVIGSQVIDPPKNWQEGLVCVISNGVFDAAGYAFDENEMSVFLAPDFGTQRPRTWMLVPNAKEIVGYKD